MQYGICTLAQIAVRLYRSESSELVTQMLFGETCKIIDQKNNWFFVYTDTDQYLGWIDTKTIHIISFEIYKKLNENSQHPVLSSCTGTIRSNGEMRLISQGSSLPFLHKGHGNIGQFQYELLTGHTNKNIKPYVAAKELTGAPYLWGGRTALGIDCSALIVNTFKIAGILLPRDASEQVSYGEHVNFIHDAEPGDLCFFDNSEGRIIHTGILLDKENIIHASGQVRIDKIDHQGIYNIERKQYTHSLRIIKRLLKNK